MFRRRNNTDNNSDPVAEVAQPKSVMSSRKAVPSVISSDMHILGNIVSDGIIDFAGNIDGNIRCKSLVLRKQGTINGEVHAETVQIHGHVKGMIKSKSVHLHATANVEGVVMHEMIAIEDGANIEGKIKRSNKMARIDDMHREPSYEDSFGNIEDTLEPPKLLDNIRLISG